MIVGQQQPWQATAPAPRRRHASRHGAVAAVQWTLAVLCAGYYTSRYAFFWVFVALLVAERAIARAAQPRVAAT